jgi:hypothetical protein
MIPIYYIYLDVSRFLFIFLTFELKKNERFSLLRFFYFRSSKWWWWGELLRIGIGMNRNVIFCWSSTISLCFRFLLPCLPVFLFFAAFICNGFSFLFVSRDKVYAVCKYALLYQSFSVLPIFFSC